MIFQKSTQTPAQAQGLLRRLAVLDGRVKIAAALLLGLALWTLPLAGVLLLSCGLLVLGWVLLSAGWITAGSLRAMFLFGLGWGATSFGLKLWDGLPMATAGADSAVLAIRLASLMGLGLILARLSSAVQLGRAAAWYLRPIGRKRAADVGLSLAMMIRFIPITWEAYSQARLALSLRRPRRSWLVRQALLSQTLLRVLGEKTWGMALALTSRKIEL